MVVAPWREGIVCELLIPRAGLRPRSHTCRDEPEEDSRDTGDEARAVQAGVVFPQAPLVLGETQLEQMMKRHIGADFLVSREGELLAGAGATGLWLAHAARRLHPGRHLVQDDPGAAQAKGRPPPPGELRAPVLHPVDEEEGVAASSCITGSNTFISAGGTRPDSRGSRPLPSSSSWCSGRWRWPTGFPGGGASPPSWGSEPCVRGPVVRSLVSSGVGVAEGRAATENDRLFPPSAAYPRVSEVTAIALVERGVHAHCTESGHVWPLLGTRSNDRLLCRA